jgi:transglutaminase-like putative cysteine protease
MDREERAKKVSVEFMGVSQFAWIGKDGAALREEGPLGIRLEQVTKEEALQKIALVPGTDIAAFASIPSSRMIRAVNQLTELRLTLTGVDERVLSLEGDRQSFQDRVLIIRKELVSDPLFQHQARKASEEMKKYLEPTPFIQADHPEIQAKAKEIISPDDTMMVKAGKLVDWVNKNLQKRPVLSVPNALEILRNRVGDCNEHAVLLTALARAAGIPAEMEAGIVYQRGRFYYHAWNVFYFGAWVTADATMGQIPADVTHIRLVRGMERQIDLMRVIGRMKINIEGYSR